MKGVTSCGAVPLVPGSDTDFMWRRWRRLHQNMNSMRAMRARPPTTPPTIAPTGVLEPVVLFWEAPGTSEGLLDAVVEPDEGEFGVEVLVT